MTKKFDISCWRRRCFSHDLSPRSASLYLCVAVHVLYEKSYDVAMLVTIAAMTRQEMSMMWLCSWLHQQRLGKRCRTFSSPKAVFKTALGDEKVRHLLCRRCYIHDISHRSLCLCISVSLYMLCAYDHIRAMCDMVCLGRICMMKSSTSLVDVGAALVTILVQGLRLCISVSL